MSLKAELCMTNQLLKRWRVLGVIVAVVIGVADSAFCHWKSMGCEIEKEKLGEVKG
jgi:hypothetical protein